MVGEVDRGVMLAEFFDDGAADAPGTAGDESDLLGEICGVAGGLLLIHIDI